MRKDESSILGNSGRSDVIDLTEPDQDLRILTAAPSEAQVLPVKGHGVRPGHRGWLIGAVGALLCAIALAAFLFVTKTPPLTNLSAEVTSAGEVALSFPQTGTLTQIFVTPGERIGKGQAIAMESVPGLSQEVSQDRAAVKSDLDEEAYLRSMLSSQQKTFSTGQGSLSDILSQELNAAIQTVNAARSQQQTIAASNDSLVAANQNALSVAQASEQAECAGVTAATPASSPAQVNCLGAQNRVAADQVSLAQAETTQTVDDANATAAVSQSQHELSTDEAAIATEQASTLPSYVSLQSDLTSVRTQTAKDQAALAAAQSRVQSQELFAPFAGKLQSVNGTVGEVTGQGGVSTSGTSGNSVAVSPGFQLFPTTQSESAASSGSTPIAVLASSRHVLIDALVPESQISLVKVGAQAVFSSGVTGLGDLEGVVQQIFPRPTVAAGVISYEVQIIGDRAGQDYLNGVTGTVNISKAK